MTVKSIVSKIEKENNINILAMVELGSRAYNLHSEKSDHDMYFVYNQPIEKYVMVDEYIENINLGEIITNWDVQGWNIKKFADLVYNSNPTALEFLSSSENCYYKSQKTKQIFNNLEKYSIQNANLIGLYYHYNSLAKRQYEKYIVQNWKINNKELSEFKFSNDIDYKDINPTIITENEETKLSLGRIGKYPIDKAYENNWVRKTTTQRTVKRNLYLIRGICCAKWVKNKKSMPPLKFDELIEKQDFLSKNIKKQIKKLISKKQKNNNENIDKFLPEFVEKELNETINNQEYNTGKLDKNKINSFVKKCIN